jgi:hypothetical protein
LPATKPDAPISPAVAATQTAFHCRQAAEYFVDSNQRHQSPRMRTLNRNRFIADARHGLSALGLDAFLVEFGQSMPVRSERGDFEQAEPIIRALWADMQSQPAARAELPGHAANAALANQLIETALRLIRQPAAAA